MIERESRALARAEARNQVAEEAVTTLNKEKQGREILRNERARMASILVPVVILACALWIAVMGFINVRSRREEIGILRAMGVSTRRIFMLFIWKHISIGILGGFFGLVAGSTVVFFFSGPDTGNPFGAAGPPLFWIGLAALLVWFGPSGADSWKQFAAGWVVHFLPVAVFALIIAVWFRNNILAYVGASFAIALASPLVEMIQEPQSFLRTNGIGIAIVALLVFLWLFTGGKSEPAPGSPPAAIEPQ